MRVSFLCSALVIAVAWPVGGSSDFAAHAAHADRSFIPVRLCASLPIGTTASSALTRGMDNSVVLATARWQARFRARHLRLLMPLELNDSLGHTSNFNPAAERRNANLCIRRRDTFGYIGPLNSPIAPYSEPILNRAGMVQIGPSTTDPTLTSPDPAIRGALEPATFHHRLPYVTFYRTITTDAVQGPAAAATIKTALHASTYILVDDRSPYATSIGGALQAYALKIHLRLLGNPHVGYGHPASEPHAVLSVADSVVAEDPPVVYDAVTNVYGATLLKDLRRDGYDGPVIGPDAIYNPTFIAEAGPAARNTYATEVGPDPAAASARFRTLYRARFHVGLEYYDAPTYDAADIELHAI